MDKIATGGEINPDYPGAEEINPGAGATGGEALLTEVVQALMVEGLEEGEMSDNALLTLHSIFQQNLVLALDLVERGAVTKYITTNSSAGAASAVVARQLHLVRGSTGNQYICFLSSNYCSCPSFVYNVLVKEDAMLCKHQLAVRLATATGKCGVVQVTGEEWAGLVAMDTADGQ